MMCQIPACCSLHISRAGDYFHKIGFSGLSGPSGRECHLSTPPLRIVFPAAAKAKGCLKLPGLGTIMGEVEKVTQQMSYAVL
ncbi:MAG: hypothetical protein DRG82_03830 [Deltaproteobacteria bacterium]|nr:MAG: hypothetical protein B1H13_13865 [Desulfobacteraceae bacterium 4484_190.3]RLB18450.1 MAG: hypothetical protein DRG82_03830 [Deltaproteobacteria bacterium]